MDAAFDIDLERDLLAACLRDPTIVKSALPVLRRHDFSEKVYAWIWGVIADCYGQHRELATARIFSVRLERDFRDEDEQEQVIEVLVGLRRLKPKAPRSALEEVRRFVRMAATRRAVSDMIDGLDKGDLGLATQAIADAGRDVKAAELLTEPESWSATVEDRLEQYMGAPDRLAYPTPIATINKWIGGGLWAGGVGIIVATTNVGKSTLAVDTGYASLFRIGAVVVHIPTEETKLECAARYDARITGIERSAMLSGELTTDQQQHIRDVFCRREEAIGDRLIIHELAPGSSVEGIRVVVEQARENFPDAPILVVADSLDHLAPPGRQESHRLSQSELYWYALALAKDPILSPIALWSTVQAPAEYIRRQLDKGAVSESQDKSRVAKIMIGLDDRADTDGDLDPNFDALLLWLLKNRQHRVKGKKVYVGGNMGTCTFRELSALEVEGDGEDE